MPAALERKRHCLDQLFGTYHRREWVSPDPLETLYDFPDLCDREIVAMVAAALAFGGVTVIISNIRHVLSMLEGQPCAFLQSHTRRELRQRFRSFRHRWVDGQQMADFCFAVAAAQRECGSLESAIEIDDSAVTERAPAALLSLTSAICRMGDISHGALLSDPTGGSACKRLHLFLRWMVRCDEIDPGGWTLLKPADLWIPLDRHMHRLGRAMRMTRRKSADGMAALEMTRTFRRIRPEDPVRYDFALTRLGIRKEREDEAMFVRRWKGRT